MEDCDVLVVGGGPAGSSLSWGLRDSRLNVLVMDRQTFPRDKVCAGWITPAVMDTLQIDIADYRSQRVLEPIRGFRTGIIDGRCMDIRYRGDPVSYAIRRCEFDDYLLRRSGAGLRLGKPVKKLHRDGNTWIVNNEIRTPLLVGAGGHYCPVARFTGTVSGHKEIPVIAQETEFRLTTEQAAACKILPDMPELYFCNDFRGYGWALRKGQYLNIGLGREVPGNLHTHINGFCDFLRYRGKLPSAISPEFSGHAYLLYHHCQRQIISDGIVLIGDAAGLASPRSGEGIRPAVESGLLAARSIMEARGRYDRNSLRPYEQSVRDRFGTRNGFATSIPEWVKPRLAGLLLANRWFVRNVVMNHWFLHTEQAIL